jgi:hypothetical protein
MTATGRPDPSPVAMQQLNSYSPEVFSLGTAIEVRDHFCATWCPGFEIAGSTDCGYLIRRVADRYVLPLTFAAHEVRRVC